LCSLLYNLRKFGAAGERALPYLALPDEIDLSNPAMAADPMQMGVISIEQLFASLNHELGEIDGIDPQGDTGQSPGNIASSGADIKNGTRLIGDKICEYLEHIIWIWWAKTVGIDDLVIFERFGVIGAEMLWFWLHLLSPLTV
jgi:hypothetical protein